VFFFTRVRWCNGSNNNIIKYLRNIIYYYNIIRSARLIENGQLIWNTVQLFYVINYYCYVGFSFSIFFFITVHYSICLFVVWHYYTIVSACQFVDCVCLGRAAAGSVQISYTHMITRGKTDSRYKGALHYIIVVVVV